MADACSGSFVVDETGSFCATKPMRRHPASICTTACNGSAINVRRHGQAVRIGEQMLIDKWLAALEQRLQRDALAVKGGSWLASTSADCSMPESSFCSGFRPLNTKAAFACRRRQRARRRRQAALWLVPPPAKPRNAAAYRAPVGWTTTRLLHCQCRPTW